MTLDSGGPSAPRARLYDGFSGAIQSQVANPGRARARDETVCRAGIQHVDELIGTRSVRSRSSEDRIREAETPSTACASEAASVTNHRVLVEARAT